MSEIEQPGPSDSHVFYRVAPAIYEQMRAELDSVWEHPTDTVDTCVPPADQATHDAEGYIIAPVEWSYTQRPEVAERLEPLIAAGHVEVVYRDEWLAAQGEGEG